MPADLTAAKPFDKVPSGALGTMMANLQHTAGAAILSAIVGLASIQTAQDATPTAATPAEIPADSDLRAPGTADLLFMSNHEGNGEIYLAPAGTQDPTRWLNLTGDPANDNWPQWSPDGERIAFQSRRSSNLDIWLMNADGTSPYRLTEARRSPLPAAPAVRLRAAGGRA